MARGTVRRGRRCFRSTVEHGLRSNRQHNGVGDDEKGKSEPEKESASVREGDVARGDDKE